MLHSEKVLLFFSPMLSDSVSPYIYLDIFGLRKMHCSFKAEYNKFSKSTPLILAAAPVSETVTDGITAI